MMKKSYFLSPSKCIMQCVMDFISAGLSMNFKN